MGDAFHMYRTLPSQNCQGVIHEYQQLIQISADVYAVQEKNQHRHRGPFVTKTQNKLLDSLFYWEFMRIRSIVQEAAVIFTGYSNRNK